MDTPLILCEGLSKTYGSDGVETHALRGVSFSIAKGEFVAIMGPSGSGKSTLMHLLGFLDRPTGGTYYFRGEDAKTFDDEKLAHLRNQNIGFIFQTFNLLPRTSVFENVELPLLYDVYPRTNPSANETVRSAIIHPRDYMHQLLQSMGGNYHKEKVMQALRAVGMEHRKDYLSNQLSGGEKQRVAIARALTNNPDLIFADEPTGNLDSKSGLNVLSILQKLNEKGHTIILVTHESSTAEHAQRLLKMHDGEIIADEFVRSRRVAEQETVLK